jgi:hypothetical protein
MNLHVIMDIDYEHHAGICTIIGLVVCRIRGSQSGGYEKYYILGYNAV